MNTNFSWRWLQLGTAVLSLCVFTASAAEDCSTLKLTDIFRSANQPFHYDQFGAALAANESLLVIGSPGEFSRPPTGALHVYFRHGTSILDYQRLSFTQTPAPNLLGNVVALDGTSIFCGFPDSSQVYTFDREGTNWVLSDPIVASDFSTASYFGYSVAAFGDTLVIGAPGDDGVVGAVYVFHRSNGVWMETAKLKASNGEAWDAFGYDVATDQNRIVVGTARRARGREPGIGYVFRNDAGTWVEEGKFIPVNNSRIFIDYGIEVIISGDVAAITDRQGSSQKAVHVFQRTDKGWEISQTISPAQPSLEPGFGFGLQMLGNRLAIGSLGGTASGMPRGMVHIFQKCDAGWCYEQTIESVTGYPEQSFGREFALFPNGILVGVNGDFSGPDRRGTVFLYENDLDDPVINSVQASPNLLWPPNRKLIPVTIEVSAFDDCGPVNCSISHVESDALLNPDDWQITGDLSLNLRAARNPDGSTRTYRVIVDCVDGAGHSSPAETFIVVPHDMRNTDE